MPDLFDVKMGKNELMKRIGEISQVAGIKEYVLSQGKGRGVRAIDVRTGGGLNFTVVPDRGMDIAWADYRSVPISFISSTGMVSPAYFEEYGTNFYRSFYAGLMTTCGLTYIGADCVDNGEKLGVHGRIGNIPAEEVCAYSEWNDEELVFTVKGKVRESKVDEENLVLCREIKAVLGENKIFIKNSVENCGFDKAPLMALFHINIGYPLLSEDSVFFTSEAQVAPRDAEAAKGLDEYNVFSAPAHQYAEQVFYHKMAARPDGKAYAVLYNKKLGFGFYVKYDMNELPCFTQWKQTGEGTYALGMEPGTNHPEPRNVVRENNDLVFIEAGEVKELNLEMGIIDDMGDME